VPEFSAWPPTAPMAGAGDRAKGSRRYRGLMALVRIEFTIEPFTEGRPGPHVQAAVDAVESAGLSVDFGPFSSVAEGDDSIVVAALGDLVRDALAAGATRISLQVTRDGGT